jgi:hypothetical protein
MDFWDLLSYAGWIVSGLIFLWIAVDATRVGKEYEEDFLLSSREGEE